MGKFQSKTIHMCFGGIITISMLHFIGYYQTLTRFSLDDKDVLSLQKEIQKDVDTKITMKNGYPVMNTSIYEWHPRDLIRMPLPSYLPGMKTPCFFVEDDGSSTFSEG